MRLQIWHIVVLVIAFVLLFGWKNLPNAARSLGESMRVFKSEVDQMKDDSTARKDRTAADPAPEPDALPRPDDQTDGRYQDSAQEEYRRIQQHGSEGDTDVPRR